MGVHCLSSNCRIHCGKRAESTLLALPDPCQIAERERLLTEWQARLDRKGAELEEAQRAAEVRGQLHAPLDAVIRSCS